MAKTIAGLQLEASIKGPWLSRAFPSVTEQTVLLVARHWRPITASQGERRWAIKKIKSEISKAFPLIYAWLIKMVVSLVIYWILSKRSLEFDKEMEEINHYL
jgi:hypothetical protein